MPAGRPPSFSSVEDLQAKIDEYFAKDGPAYIGEDDDKHYCPTVSGLAYHLEIATETLRAYGEKDEYSATVKRAKQKIEMALEQRLSGQAVTGTIFNLKNNFGWKDSQDINHGGQPNNPVTTITRTIIDTDESGHQDP